MHNTADLIIIGGGIIGAGCAYSAAKSGRSVILLEMKEPCYGAGGATDGIIAVHTKTPGVRLRMSYRSAKMFPDLLDELGDSCEYRPNCGGYILCKDALEYETVQKNVEAERADGVDIRMIDGKELRELEPNVASHIYGAKYAPETSIINTFSLIYRYIKRAQDYGAKVFPFRQVLDYIRKGDRVVGVHTNNGDFYGDLTVNCTGPWAGETSKPLGLDIPIRPRKGQIIISEPVEKFAHGAFATATYTLIKYYPERAKEILNEHQERLGNAFGIEQTDAGTLLIASTRELCGFDKRNTLDGIATVLNTAVEYMPRLREINFIRTFSGFRPFCADGQSVLGSVDHIPGYAIVAGHEGDGIALSPLVNEMFIDFLEGRPSYFDRSMFSPQRFVK